MNSGYHTWSHMVLDNAFGRIALGNMCHDQNIQDGNSNHHKAKASKYIHTHTAHSIHHRDMEDMYQNRIVSSDDDGLW